MIDNQPPLVVQHLPNGLTLLGQPMRDVASAACCFFVRAGARDEDAAHGGISHFLEHMVFKGTSTRDGPAIDRAFLELGAEYNAATSVEYTYYWSRVLGENLEPVVQLLADMLRPRLWADDLAAERHVILEEIARAEDLPDRVLMRALLDGFFSDHPLGASVLGSRESISAMTIEDMRGYWAQQYGAANIVFAAAGNLDWERISRHVTLLCGEWEAGQASRALRPAVVRSGFQVLTRTAMQQQILAAALPAPPRGDPDRYAAEVVGAVLGDRTGSRLYWGVREQGLAQSAVASLSAHSDAGMLVLYVRAEPYRAPAAWAAVRHELALLQVEGVLPAELARAKTKLSSRMVMDGESTTQRMMALVGSWMEVGRLEPLDDVVGAIDAVTDTDCRRMLDRFPLTTDPYVVTLGPLHDRFDRQ